MMDASFTFLFSKHQYKTARWCQHYPFLFNKPWHDPFHTCNYRHTCRRRPLDSHSRCNRIHCIGTWIPVSSLPLPRPRPCRRRDASSCSWPRGGNAFHSHGHSLPHIGRAGRGPDNGAHSNRNIRRRTWVHTADTRTCGRNGVPDRDSAGPGNFRCSRYSHSYCPCNILRVMREVGRVLRSVPQCPNMVPMTLKLQLCRLGGGRPLGKHLTTASAFDWLGFAIGRS